MIFLLIPSTGQSRKSIIQTSRSSYGHTSFSIFHVHSNMPSQINSIKKRLPYLFHLRPTQNPSLYDFLTETTSASYNSRSEICLQFSYKIIPTHRPLAQTILKEITYLLMRRRQASLEEIISTAARTTLTVMGCFVLGSFLPCLSSSVGAVKLEKDLIL